MSQCMVAKGEDLHMIRTEHSFHHLWRTITVRSQDRLYMRMNSRDEGPK